MTTKNNFKCEGGIQGGGGGKPRPKDKPAESGDSSSQLKR